MPSPSRAYYMVSPCPVVRPYRRYVPHFFSYDLCLFVQLTCKGPISCPMDVILFSNVYPHPFSDFSHHLSNCRHLIFVTGPFVAAVSFNTTEQLIPTTKLPPRSSDVFKYVVSDIPINQMLLVLCVDSNTPFYYYFRIHGAWSIYPSKTFRPYLWDASMIIGNCTVTKNL